MIAKLRKKFVLLTMCSLTAVLLLIMGVINFSSFWDLQQQADSLLTILAENDGNFPRPDKINLKSLPRNRMMTAETPYETRYFTVLLDENGAVLEVNTGSIAAISTEDAIQYAMEISARGRSGGFYENFKYRKTDTAQGSLLIFLDRGRELASFRMFLSNSLLVSAVCILAVFLLVVYFSKKVVRPVAESYEKQKRFITDAGHELKTPLAIIETNAEVLELEHGQSKWTDSIRHQVRRLSRLTESLVSLARMDESAASLVMVAFSLSDAVEESAAPFVDLAAARGKRLTLQIQPQISYLGNENVLRQLTGILLDNAVKYAAPVSEIVLSLKKQGKGVVLRCDNPVEHIQKGDLSILFERFYRADTSRSSENGGYGVGLSLAQAIVAAHKGKLTAFSADGVSLEVTALL